MDALTYRPAISAEREERNRDRADTADCVEGNEVGIDTPIESEHRYLQRDRRAPSFFSPGSANIANSFAGINDALPDPSSIQEAMEREDAVNCKEAIESELESLRIHGTWEAVSLPKGVNSLSTKFVSLRKCDEKGSVIRYKARLVVIGFLQGDVDQTFARVVAFSTVRTALAVDNQKGYVIQQLDVRTACLHGDFDSEIYVKPLLE